MSEIWAFLVGLIALVIPGFGADQAPFYAGYVEADYVYAAASSAGTIELFAVVQGQAVAKGNVLYVLNHAQQQALLDAAEARVSAAEATARNLETGDREAEIEVVRASLAKAEADLALAQQTLQRSEKLLAGALVPEAKVDQDRATLASAVAQVAQLKAQLAVSELPARSEQLLAAEANLLAARADADKARSDLTDRTVLAAADGIVEKLYYQAGEMVPAGSPVLSLLPADALKIKFYIGEAERPGFAIGEVLDITCDGCAAGLTARVSYFASDPQFTPPVIYSREERTRLVFLAEAVVEAPGTLLPGQPVSIGRRP